MGVGLGTAMLIGGGLAGAGSLGAAAISKGGGGGGGVGRAMALTPDARKLYDELVGMTRRGMGADIPVYEDDRVAPRHPLEDMLAEYYGQAAPGVMGMTDIIPQALEGYDPMRPWQTLDMAMGPMQQMIAPFDPAATQELWRKSVLGPSRNAWEEVQESIREGNVRAGRGSSGYLDAALAEAGGDLQTAREAELARMTFQGEQAQLGRQQSGINQLMNMIGMPSQIMGQAAGVQGLGSSILGQAGAAGAEISSYEQALINAAMGKFKEQQGPTWPELIPTILGTKPELYYQQPQPGIGSVLGPALGGLLGGEGFQNLLSPQQAYGGTTSGFGNYVQQNPWGGGGGGSGWGNWSPTSNYGANYGGTYTGGGTFW